MSSEENKIQSLTTKVDDLTKQLKASEEEKTKEAQEEEKKEAKKSMIFVSRLQTTF